MNRVKKLLILTMAMALSCLLLTACSSSSSSEKKESAPQKDQTTVSVVSKSTEKVPGMNAPVVTEYEYDDNGRLISSTKTGDSSFNNKTTYEYNDKNELISTSTTFEQYGWNEGFKESFEYDSNHNCVKYHSEMTFEGDGSTDATFTYDASGQITEANVKFFADNEPISDYTYKYEYLADGIIKSISSSSQDAPTFAINELFSDMLKGAYTYDDSSNARTVLAFDETGLLKTIEGASQAGQTKTEFEYTQIEVKPAEYLPTIYSNPQGFNTSTLPSLSEAIRITLVK